MARRQQAHGDDDDLTVEEIQARARRVNDESLQSTRHMVSMCYESEEAGSKTLAQLGAQGEQLNKIEIGIENVGENVLEADDALTGANKFQLAGHLHRIEYYTVQVRYK
jgi:hypothetical protein